MANSVEPDQTAPIGAWVTLFASILNSSVMLGNYLQQTISADDIFRCFFSWLFKGQGFNIFSIFINSYFHWKTKDWSVF